jgi:hypothetical protein
LDRVGTVDIVVVLYNAKSEIVGFSKTQAHNISPYEQRSFRIIWSAPPSGTVARPEGSAMVDIGPYVKD